MAEDGKNEEGERKENSARSRLLVGRDLGEAGADAVTVGEEKMAERAPNRTRKEARPARTKTSRPQAIFEEGKGMKREFQVDSGLQDEVMAMRWEPAAADAAAAAARLDGGRSSLAVGSRGER